MVDALPHRLSLAYVDLDQAIDDQMISSLGGFLMPKFTVLSRVDAYVDYVCEVEANSAEDAVDIAYEGHASLEWKERGVVEFDSVRMLALTEDGDEDDSYVVGDA